jgi:diguanylate cyclase (GGDEF)-like protein
MTDLIEQLADLAQLRDVDALDTAMCRLARRCVDANGVAIHRLVSDRGDTRWLTTGHSDPAMGHGAVGELPRLDEHPVWRDGLLAEQALDLTEGQHQTIFPLADRRGGKGVMEVHSGAALDADRRRLITSLLGFHGHLRGLMDDNERDALTGLLNRKSFDEAFVRAAMATEAAEPQKVDDAADRPERRDAAGSARHWLAVVDIDHFKRVNDTFGHLIGDEVLLLIAQLMRQTLRQSDRIYRFGGEEFVVLLRCPHGQAALAVFERLRLRVCSHDFPQVGQLTVSIGYTAVDADDTPGLAFERADLAVYQAKQEGRNRTLSHADLAISESANAARGALEFF